MQGIYFTYDNTLYNGKNSIVPKQSEADKVFNFFFRSTTDSLSLFDWSQTVALNDNLGAADAIN